MEMRKVLFKKWIKPERKMIGSTSVLLKGTGCYEEEFKNKGHFLTWGTSWEEVGDGVGNFTIAIVELEDGTLQEVLISNLKFI
jgi:hypothetical protein